MVDHVPRALLIAGWSVRGVAGQERCYDKRMVRVAVKIVVTLGLATFVAGCVKIPPYDGMRLLGHPTMTVEEISIGVDGHVRAVSEGATGGLGVGASCGCD